MARPPVQPEVLLTPGEVAKIFRVRPATVLHWANDGKLHPIKTLGGHRRYKKSEVMAILAGLSKPHTP